MGGACIAVGGASSPKPPPPPRNYKKYNSNLLVIGYEGKGFGLQFENVNLSTGRRYRLAALKQNINNFLMNVYIYIYIYIYISSVYTSVHIITLRASPVQYFVTWHKLNNKHHKTVGLFLICFNI